MAIRGLLIGLPEMSPKEFLNNSLRGFCFDSALLEAVASP